MSDQIRDYAADYAAALAAEHASYTAAGLEDKAAQVASVIESLEKRPKRPEVGDFERAVPSEPVETAVNTEPPKRGRGRPPKNAAD